MVDISEEMNHPISAVYSDRITTPTVFEVTYDNSYDTTNGDELPEGAYENDFGVYEPVYLEAGSTVFSLSAESALVEYDDYNAATYELNPSFSSIVGHFSWLHPQRIHNITESGWYAVFPAYMLHLDHTPDSENYVNYNYGYVFSPKFQFAVFGKISGNGYPGIDYAIVAPVKHLYQDIVFHSPMIRRVSGEIGYFYSVSFDRYSRESKLTITVGGKLVYQSTNGKNVQLYIPAHPGLEYAASVQFGANTQVYTWVCQNATGETEPIIPSLRDYRGIFPELKPSAFYGYFGIIIPKQEGILINLDPTITIAGVIVGITTETENQEITIPTITIAGVIVGITTETENREITTPTITIAGVTVGITTETMEI